MKKKIILTGILAALMLGTTVFAGVSVPGGVLDRAFDEGRTLYYVEIKSDAIPEISADGYTVLKTATKPYSGGALTEDNTTIIKNNETGKRYRFVFEKKGGSMDVTSLDLSTSGKLTVKGRVEGYENIKLLVLKPTEDFGETAFEISDINSTEMEKTVLDVVEKESKDIKDGVLFDYSFPTGAKSGQYGFLVTADGETYYTTRFYMSENDIKDIVSTVNEKSVFDETNTVLKLKEYIEQKAKMLYLDLTDYDKLSDDAKTVAIKGLESEGDYENAEQIGEKFNKGVTVAWIYDGRPLDEILKDNSYITLEMYEKYLELDDKKGIEAMLKGKDSEEAIKTAFNGAVTLYMLNEAEPADIKGIVEDYNEYLGIEESLYNYFISNSEKCIRALGNKNFDSVSELEEEIKKIKNAGTGTGGGGGSSSGGISSKVPSTGTGYVAPITEQKPTVSENPKENPESETKNNLPFEDIEDVKWAYTAIEHLYNNKILNGKSETKFAPGDYVKREEFVKLVVNGFGFDKMGKMEFSDVDENAWYKDFLNIAVNAGVVNGISETEFGVGKNITREDIAVMIYRAVQQSGMNVDIIVEDVAELSDLDSVSDYAKEAVEFMISKGAVNGINGEFKPKAYATRAQTAQMLYQIIKIR